MKLQKVLTLLAICLGSDAAIDLAWHDDTDLTSFVTHPEIRAPKFDVKVYDADRVTPGYWFIGPYAAIEQPVPSPKYYQPCQTGPHIYDGEGNLVWSGACVVDNQNTCDFRAWNINGTNYLSMILYKYKDDPVGRGAIMDSSYRFIHEVRAPTFVQAFNMHELNLVDNGNAALHFVHRAEFVDVSDIPDEAVDAGWIINMGIREVDIHTGETRFEWWAHPEVSLTESRVKPQSLNGPLPGGWNWFHGNSIVKNADGDYLVSSRYTDTVYKIYGSTGRIAWRLGGNKSDFQLLGFNFSRQHDAQWVESGSSSDGKETISLLDNGSDGITKTSTVSSGLTIELDKGSMTASVVKRWNRPDHQLSDLRGNFQRLPNGNVFAAWSDNSFISEHTSDDELVMEAQFTSKRFVTYRAYKMNFTGTPVDPPVLKAFVYGVDEDSSTTVFYVSWNGATEVARWNFYGVSDRDSPEILLGTKKRTGFETQFQSRGFERQVFAEAVKADGSILGRSDTFHIETPPHWATADDVTWPDDVAPTKEQPMTASVKTEL